MKVFLLKITLKKLDPKYFINNELSIPNGINLFINDILNENLVVANDDYSLVSYIEGRRKRLIANNLIIGSSFQLSNNFEIRSMI